MSGGKGAVRVARRRVVTFERYLQLGKWSADYGQALVRTNLAVRCWLRRGGGSPRPRRGGQPPGPVVLAWLLVNHIIQAFYRSYGIDVAADGNGNDYHFMVKTADGCKRGEPAVLARIHARPDAGAVWVEAGATGARPIEVQERILAGADPLWAVDEAAIAAVGGRWPPHCHRRSCPHRRDAERYLSVSQIVTLLLCMGQAAGAAMDPGGDYLLRLASGETVRIDRRSGALVQLQPALVLLDPARGSMARGQDAPYPFDHWCRGDVDGGLGFLCRASTRLP